MMEQLELLLSDVSSRGEIKQDKNRYTVNGIPVPSVTQVLNKCINEPYIAQWANYLGFKRIKYQEELNRAANIGTKGHNAIEEYIKDGTESTNICCKSFLLWWDMIHLNHKVEVVGMEEKLLLPYCGGTYDLLLIIDGKYYLVDFKTSNKVSYKYFIQLAAYRRMLYLTKNINIDGCIVLQVDKFEPGFNEFLLDFSNTDHYEFIEHCSNTFMSLCLSYYHVLQAEMMYKKIF